MDNQQPSTYKENLILLAKNSKFGDGHLWKHPEGINYKIRYTSIDKELLEVKMNLYPEIFPAGIGLLNLKNAKGRFPNAKSLYKLDSLTHSIFTEYAKISKWKLFETLSIEDFGLWYLDDGCCIKRSDGGSYRYILSIGDCCKNKIREELFKQQLVKLFGNNFGRICLNGPKASNKNKAWIIPKPIANTILKEAKKYGVLARKFPYGKGSTTISKESRRIGLSPPKRHPLKKYNLSEDIV